MDRAVHDPGRAGASTPRTDHHDGADHQSNQTDHDADRSADRSADRRASPPASSPGGPGGDPEEIHDLAERLRSQGVVVVAGRAVAGCRPEGVDLLGALPVLTREVAQEWLDAADRLPVLNPDRLQLRSAAALLMQGAAAADADAVQADPLNTAAVARAVALRSQLQLTDPGPGGDAREETEDGDPGGRAEALLDRTWAVLCDLRRLAAGPSETPVRDARGLGIVPSAAQATAEQARRLGPALHRAACAGALVGMLAPWLPPSRLDTLATVDSLLEAVSGMSRLPADRAWWSTLVTMGRVAASLTVAACHAAARYSGRSSDAVALVLSEPALGRLADQALSMAAAPSGPAPATGDDHEDGARTDRPMPLASPSQQARAAAERAAAERRATQQAFMERAHATRAARSAGTAAAGSGPVDTRGPDLALVHRPRDGETPPKPSAAAPAPVPALADVGAELDDGEEDEISLGVWDTLMRPR